MLEFLTKLWRWIKGLFVRRAARPGQDVHRPVAARPALSDVEYENYFMQLLETLEQGLGRGELRGWLITRRVREEELANWLGRQRERWMAQPEQHGELARRLERLGRVASGELGVVAGAIGATVLEQQITDNDSGQIEDRETSSLEELPESRSSGVGEEGKTDDVDSRLDEVIQQHRAGNLSEALKLSKRIIEDYPEDFRGWSLDGFLLSNLGREKEALASYEEAIKYKPDYYIYWYVRGNTLSNLGREEEALASYGEAIKHKPDYHIAWSNRGNALSDLGRYEQAIASHEEAIKHKPDCHEAWSNRGNALSDLGRYEEAIASHEEAIKHKPDYHIAWTNRGVVLSNLERYEEALASHEEAIKHELEGYLAWYGRGKALSDLGLHE
ncbi:MAG: tetratricopeptide repeat protein, partial [Cyanobacteria bacterium P01_A01_bin.135]